jgi:hypothetical protein
MLQKMKKCYIITYQLKNPGINQQTLIDSIKTADHWAKLTQTSYLISTELSSVQIRDALLPVLKEGDTIYVSLVGNSSAWIGLDNEVSTWIQNNQK